MKPSNAVRVYIAGPMTGLPANNYPAFDDVAGKLRARGFHVENPAENPPPECGTWRGWMRLAVRQLATCDAVALLPGWMASKGARTEFRLATDLELQVITVEELLS